MGKVDENKKKKKEALFNTAYELFTTKGINATAISDIVEKAGVAKGTFYLYFKDKYDIKNKLIVFDLRCGSGNGGFHSFCLDTKGFSVIHGYAPF